MPLKTIKIKVEGFYKNEVKKYTDSNSLLGNATYCFTKYWNKTKEDLFNPTITFKEIETRIEEAKKKCSLMERRTNTAVYHFNRA
ncbi:MAG: hypothetical protein EOP34_04755 [Rickettsiales bacterium]|nr:MAG: hypothetical protein EOP34_04755 [Rickettsiales bacterium]